MRHLRTVAVALVAFYLASAGGAQTHPNLVTNGTSSSGGELDSVNLFNGSLSLVVPIGAPFHVNGHLSYGLSVSYSSSLWRFTKRRDLSGPEPITYTQASLDPRANAGEGWVLSLGDLYSPNTPQFNDGSNWVYVDEVGAEHLFYSTLHDGETETDPYDDYQYTRDNSYLRMRDVPSDQWETSWLAEREIQFPNGVVHVFQLSGGVWRLRWMLDAYTASLARSAITNTQNWVRVDYPTNQWVITDGHGRQQTVNFRTSAPGNGQVGTIVLEAFGAGDATYTFSYTDAASLPRSCRDDDPQTSSGIAAELLTGISLPDGSSYNSFGYNQTNASYCSIPNLPGTLTGLTLPTGGAMGYTYAAFSFPAGSACTDGWDPELGAVAGVAARQLIDTDASTATWTYQRPTFSGSDNEVTTLVTSPESDDTVYYFRTISCIDSLTYAGWDYSLPFSGSATSTVNFTTYLSTQAYDGTGAGRVLKRSSYVLYEHDKLPFLTAPHWYNTDRRLAALRTVYNDDSSKYADVRLTSFDGLGHYRVAVSGGNFGSGDVRRTRTNANPGRGHVQDHRLELQRHQLDPVRLSLHL